MKNKNKIKFFSFALSKSSIHFKFISPVFNVKASKSSADNSFEIPCNASKKNLSINSSL